MEKKKIKAYRMTHAEERENRNVYSHSQFHPIV